MTRHTIRPLTSGNSTLRSLDRRDLPLTLAWRNHADSRAWFHATATIGEDQHNQWFDMYLDDEYDHVFVVEVDGVPVAQVALRGVGDGDGELGRLLVAPEERGAGIGHVAIDLCIRAAQECLHLDRIHLEVKDTNARAIAVYERAGFVPDHDAPAPVGSTVWVRAIRRSPAS